MDYATEIKNRISMPETMLHYGFELDRAGFCCCPFHGEKTGSFKAYPGNRGFSCFGCYAHGSVIDFVMQYFGLTFWQAIEKINTDFSLGFPIGERVSLRQRREIEQKQRERKEEIEREKAECERLTAEYWVAFDRWQTYDTNKRNLAPKSPNDTFNPLFVEAVKNIDRAAYELSVAEMRLKDYANQRKHNNYN